MTQDQKMPPLEVVAWTAHTRYGALPVVSFDEPQYQESPRSYQLVKDGLGLVDVVGIEPLVRLSDAEAATQSLLAEVAELRAFHDFFRDRCEGLFAYFGMPAIDLYNAAISGGKGEA